MKKELIKTENYLLVVDDAVIKEGDVEKLGNEFSNGFALHLNRQLVAALNEGFKAGYLKAREKYKFTEEDMKNVIECTLELTKTSNGLQ